MGVSSMLYVFLRRNHRGYNETPYERTIMYTTIVVALIALFVGVIATAYYFEYKIKKNAARNRTTLPTALDLAYKKGYDAGYYQGGVDHAIAMRILNPKN